MKRSICLRFRKIVKKFVSWLDTYWLSKSLSRKTSILRTKGFLITSFTIYLICVLQEDIKFSVFTSLILQQLVLFWVLFLSKREKNKIRRRGNVLSTLDQLLYRSSIILLADSLQLRFWGGGWVALQITASLAYVPHVLTTSVQGRATESRSEWFLEARNEETQEIPEGQCKKDQIFVFKT